MTALRFVARFCPTLALVGPAGCARDAEPGQADEGVAGAQVRPDAAGPAPDVRRDAGRPLADGVVVDAAPARDGAVPMDARLRADGGASDAAVSTDMRPPDLAVTPDAVSILPDGAIQARPPGPDEDLQVLAEWLCEQISRGHTEQARTTDGVHVTGRKR